MKNKVIVISQARTGSTRLPDKVLLKILGKELLIHFVNRVKKSKKIDKIVIATTDKTNYDKIANLIDKYYKNEIDVFRVSEEDVLDRYYQASLKFLDDDTNLIIVRITSDCPLIAANIIDLHIEEFIKRKVDYLSSRINKRTWTHGMEAEVFTFQALKDAWENAKTPMEREHVTPYIYRTHPEKFKLYELSYKEDLSNLRFTVDYPEDFEFVKTIYERLYPINPYFSFNDILNLLKKEPELLEINKNRVNPDI